MHISMLQWSGKSCAYLKKRHWQRQRSGFISATEVVCLEEREAPFQEKRQSRQRFSRTVSGGTVSVRWTPDSKVGVNKESARPASPTVKADLMDAIHQLKTTAQDEFVRNPNGKSIQGTARNEVDVRLLGKRSFQPMHRKKDGAQKRTVNDNRIPEPMKQGRSQLKGKTPHLVWDGEVKNLVKLIGELPRQRGVAEALEMHLPVTQNKKRLRLLLQGLAETGHALRIPDVLMYAQSLATPIIGVNEYNAAINFCSKQADADTALRVLDLMNAASCPPTVWTFNMLITASGKARRLSQAMLILSMMRSYGCAPDTITYNSLFKACEKAGQWQQALHLIQRMHIDGCAPDHYTYNALVSIMEGIGQSQQALRILDAMQSAGVEPDIVTYNSILGAFGRQGRWQEAEELWESMAAAGVQPDVMAHNSLISCYARAGLVDLALSVIDRMKEADLSPDVATYNGLMTAVGRAGELGRAQELIQEMRNAGLTPDTVTYTALIGACAACREWRAAMQAYRHMLADGCAANSVTYSVLLEALRGSGRKQELQEVYAEMRNAKVELQEERESVLSGGRPGGMEQRERQKEADLERVADELAKLPAYRKVDDTIDKLAAELDLRGLTRLLRCLGRTAALCRTPDVVAYAESRGLDTNVFVYTQLIALLGRHGLVDEAQTAFERMQQRGIQPTVVTYSTLVGAFSRSGDSERARAAFDAMRAAGLRPNVMAFTALMSAHEKRDEWASAVRVFEDMCSEGIEPTLVTYNTLIQCCSRMYHWRLALTMFDEMRLKGFEPNSLTYSLMIRACERALEAGDTDPQLQDIIRDLKAQSIRLQTQRKETESLEAGEEL